MPNIVIYTTPYCPYCVRAKSLLDRKGVGFSEIDISTSDSLTAEMTARSGGRRTVPQIFIGERHVGGCDDLMALERRGELDPLLAG